jgi:ubiquinone/menaquinone biosynthesis C-methylase UbiE
MGRMDHLEVGDYWDRNADTWIELSRAGHDVYRDLVNTPAFLAMLAQVTGGAGLDLGCGEGHNTRLLARRGACMTALDIARRFIQAAVAEERREPLGIRYVRASAVALPFAEDAFDFVVAFMSLMDMPELDAVLAEVQRVLRRGGFLQFSIEHPCTSTQGSGWVTDEHGKRMARTIGDYFHQEPYLDRWIFSAAPRQLQRDRRPFHVPRFPRTLSVWLNSIASAGLVLDAANEPFADQAAVGHHPQLAATRTAPLFLHLRCRKPTS